jgi:hypothetical protein
MILASCWFAPPPSRARSRGIKVTAAISGVLVLCAFFGSRAAEAQALGNYLPSDLAGYDVMPGVTVTSRLRPEYDPPGVQLGTFTIRPQVSQAVGYDDNVTGTSAKHGSLLLNTLASLQAERAVPGSYVNVGMDVGQFSYPDLPSQSYTNWSGGLGGSYDIDQGDTIGIGYRHYHLNQLPTGIDSIGVVQPAPYDTDTASLSYQAVRGRWTFVPLVSFASTRFENSSNLSDFNQGVTSQDRNVETGSLATFYEFAPQRSVVLVVRGTTAQYTKGSEPRPNYSDVAVLAGLDYDITSVIRFRALVGYETRNYQKSQFEDHSSPVFEATAIWTPTGLTTVTAQLLRRIEDANENVQTGYTFTQGRLVVDHEYLRNVLLQGRAWIANADYLQTSDQQTLYGAGASATYLLNRNLTLSASYDFTKLHESGPLASSYNRNIVFIQLKAAL